MKTKLLITLLALTGFVSGTSAQQIDYFTASGVVQNFNGTTSLNGNAVWIVHFAPGFDFTSNNTFSLLLAAIGGSAGVYHNVGIGFDESGLAGGGSTVSAPAGQFYGSAFPPPAFPGAANDQIYIWTFNVANPLLTAPTQWAIVTNPLWLRPANGSTLPSTFDPTADAGTIVPTGALGQLISNGVGTFDIRMGAIPEPSVMLLGAFGLGVMAFGVRRARVI